MLQGLPGKRPGCWFFVCAVTSRSGHQSWPTLCNPIDCSPPGSSVHGISQARILEWVAISFSRGSSQPRDRTWVFCIAGRFFTISGTVISSCGYYVITQHKVSHPIKSRSWFLLTLPMRDHRWSRAGSLRVRGSLGGARGSQSSASHAFLKAGWLPGCPAPVPILKWAFVLSHSQEYVGVYLGWLFW